MSERWRRWLKEYDRIVVGSLTSVILLAFIGCVTSIDRQKSLGGPTPGSLEISEPLNIADLPKADRAEGLVLAHDGEGGECSIITYNDEFKLVTHFPATKIGRSTLRGCDNPWSYTPDYRTRVVERAVNRDVRAVVQSIGAGAPSELDVTPLESGALEPNIGPDGRIYFSLYREAEQQSGSGSVMPDGTDQESVGHITRPAWEGGKLVEGYFADRTVANSDGSLAVEYVEDTTYRVGGVQEGETMNGVYVVLSEKLEFLAWAGENRFITTDGGPRLFISEVVDEVKLTITSELLVDLSKSGIADMARGARVSHLVVCKDSVYFTLFESGRSVLVGVKTDDGTLTVMGALHGQVQVLDCA